MAFKYNTQMVSIFIELLNYCFQIGVYQNFISVS